MEIEIGEPQLYQLLPADAGAEERHHERVVAAALLAFAGALDDPPHLRVAQGAAAVLLHARHPDMTQDRLALIRTDPKLSQVARQ